MWSYDKKLQYPVKIARPNPALAKLIITQFGGPNFNRLRKFEAKSLGIHLHYYSVSVTSIICSSSFGLLTWTGQSALSKPSSLVAM